MNWANHAESINQSISFCDKIQNICFSKCSTSHQFHNACRLHFDLKFCTKLARNYTFTLFWDLRDRSFDFRWYCFVSQNLLTGIRRILSFVWNDCWSRKCRKYVFNFNQIFCNNCHKLHFVNYSSQKYIVVCKRNWFIDNHILIV